MPPQRPVQAATRRQAPQFATHYQAPVNASGGGLRPRTRAMACRIIQPRDYTPNNPKWLVAAAAADPSAPPPAPPPPPLTALLASAAAGARPPAPGSPEMSDLFRLDSSWAYLNHGSYGAALRVALDTQDWYRQRLEAQPVLFMETAGIQGGAACGCMGAAAPPPAWAWRCMWTDGGTAGAGLPPHGAALGWACMSSERLPRGCCPAPWHARLHPRMHTTPALVHAVARVAQLVKADWRDVVPVANATTGVNAVVGSLALGPGDLLLMSNATYPAVSSIPPAAASVHAIRRMGLLACRRVHAAACMQLPSTPAALHLRRC